MKPFSAIALGLGAAMLSACVGTKITPQNIEPTRAYLYTNTVNVIMNDGSLCAGHRPGRAVEWTGNLSGCPHEYPFQVAGHTSGISPRVVLAVAGPGQPSLLNVQDPAGNNYAFGR